jgi:hypothetical protein
MPAIFRELLCVLMDRTRRHIWQIAGLVFLGIVAVIVLLRANAPVRTRQGVRTTPVYTDGNIASGEITVAAGGIIKFKFDVQKRSQLRGSFATKGMPDAVTCLLLDDENFERMMRGEDLKTIANTGSVPGGRIERKLEQGVYYLVFDNRSGSKEVIVRTSEFKLE